MQKPAFSAVMIHRICYTVSLGDSRQKPWEGGSEMLSEEQQLDKLMKFLEMYPGCFFIKDKEGRYAYSSHLCEHVNPN